MNLTTDANDFMPQKYGVLKNNTPFRSYMTTTNNILIDNAETLDIVTLMYNLFAYTVNSLYNLNPKGERKKYRIMEIIELWEVELFSYI